MKRLFFPILALLMQVVLASCEDYETYGDRKAKERDAIDKYITKEGIRVISESEFDAKGQVTSLADNEYVKLNRTGVYMQIVRKGCGAPLEEKKVVNLICRFSEYNILEDTLLVRNNATCYVYNSSIGSYVDASLYPDKMSVTRMGTTITATFIEGMMMMYHNSSSSVPSGWLVPLNYINVGRPEKEGDEIAKVKLIVPHSQGTADASSSVYPCAYEITYEREK